MKLLTTLGRLLAVLFWLAVLGNLIAPFAAPFALLLNLAGAGMLLLHVLQLGLCRDRLKASTRPTRDRLLLLVFGAFFLDALPSAETVVAELLQATREADVTLAEMPLAAVHTPVAERDAA
ncbi:putative membrane protein [Pseudomonas linyingensis]|uniref:Putative membrane protein n=1 Tax=Pseudomonas linyingensis TaxID=915471 RepID=A0A1H7CDT4_9PSED|nr:DUF1145 domain-containing protein [Pseudomonas linyingensis]SEJ86727.1 putative membrane protein [Pseudomonas linyingensis]